MPAHRRRERVPPLPDIEDRERLDLLDPDALYAWETNVKGAELDDWRTIKAILTKRRGNFRSCAMSLIMMIELEDSRDAYNEAANVQNRAQKAQHIGRAGNALKTAILSLGGAWLQVHVLFRDLRNVRGDGPISHR